MDAALRDNINTPAVMDALSDLIKAVNKYLADKSVSAAGTRGAKECVTGARLKGLCMAAASYGDTRDKASVPGAGQGG